MDKKLVLESIVKIPSDFYSLGNVSIYNLVKNSGYLEIGSSISKEDLKLYLSEKQDYFDNWLNYSHDKRTSEGWYIITQNSNYIVGFLSKHIDKKLEKTFQDKYEALAFFIKQELDSIVPLD